jgi:3-oxoacyl-[acyl-carrier-protein] synthase III
MERETERSVKSTVLHRPQKAYITSLGKFLPGQPIDNDSMERFLGKINGKASRVRNKVLKQNGIHTRHYAIDQNQNSMFSNAEMAARAVLEAIDRSGLNVNDIDFLAATTSQGDFPLPGFASMVHGELNGSPCEIATLHGVCASGVMALKAAMMQILSGEKHHAVACASEFASRLFKSTRFESQKKVQEEGLSFDTEFLRWMLSDGAGAAVLGDSETATGLCFQIDWIELISYANTFAPCMYVGPKKNGKHVPSWLDYPSYESAANDGAINLRQDVRMLPEVIDHAVRGLLQLAEKGWLDLPRIDWMAVHYSSDLFRDQAYEAAHKIGLDVPRERWFTNLPSIGNVGSASIFLMLEGLLASGSLQPGETVLCLVPESGRFLFGYMLLRIVEGKTSLLPKAVHKIERTNPPELHETADPLAQSLKRGLASVWFDFEAKLQNVPIVKKLHEGHFTISDYRALLFNLRQQVIDGSRWIARAASSITPDHFPIRSAFIAHTSDEHRDFEMLERNYVVAGGTLEAIKFGQKNIGSEALFTYVLQKASQENPFELIGTMFIVEGIGQRIARQWGERIQQQLGLKDDAVSFFLYHSESDVKHFQRLDLAIASGILTEKVVADSIRCAKVTARLYILQLEEIGNF